MRTDRRIDCIRGWRGGGERGSAWSEGVCLNMPVPSAILRMRSVLIQYLIAVIDDVTAELGFDDLSVRNYSFLLQIIEKYILSKTLPTICLSVTEN